ncbi:MAG: endonuclease [Pseudomonadota bacterium]
MPAPHRLLLLAILLPPLALAGGQNKLFDAKDAVRNSFWKELYFAGGEGLWCKTKFMEPGARLTADSMYQVPWIKDAVGCTTREQCESNRDFQRMTSDLHNIYPAEKRVQLDRRNLLFDKVATSDPLPETTCVYKMFGGQIEPNNEIKGEVARAILYMHMEYDLKVPGPINMFIDWSNIDPPGKEEKTRNDLIEKIQGNRNKLIDNPRLAEKYRAR